MSTEAKWRRIDKLERVASVHHANLAVIHSYEDGWQTIAHQKSRHGYTGPMIKSSLSAGHKTGAAAQRWIEQWAADNGMV